MSTGIPLQQPNDLPPTCTCCPVHVPRPFFPAVDLATKQSAANMVRDISSLMEGLEQWIKKSEDDYQSEAVIRIKAGPGIVEALRKAEGTLENFPEIVQDTRSTQILFSRKQYDLALSVYRNLLSRSVNAVFERLREGEWMRVTLELQEGQKTLLEPNEIPSSLTPYTISHIKGHDSGAAGRGLTGPSTTSEDIQAPSPSPHPQAGAPLVQPDPCPPQHPSPPSNAEVALDAETALVPESVRTVITPPTTPPPPPYIPPPPTAPLFLEGSIVRLYRAVESLRQIQILAKPTSTYPAPNTVAPPLTSTTTTPERAPSKPAQEAAVKATNTNAAGTASSASMFGLWTRSPGKSMFPTAGVGSAITAVSEAPKQVVPPFDGIPMPGHYPPMTPSAVPEPAPHLQVREPIIPPVMFTPAPIAASANTLQQTAAPAPPSALPLSLLPVPQSAMDAERARLASEARALATAKVNAAREAILEGAQSRMMETLRRAREAAEVNNAWREAREAAKQEDERTMEARLAGDVKSREEERWEAMGEEKEKRQREERAEREEAQWQAAAVQVSKVAEEKAREEQERHAEEEVARNAQAIQAQGSDPEATREFQDAPAQSTDQAATRDTLDDQPTKDIPVQPGAQGRPHTIKKVETDPLGENFPKEAALSAAEAARAEAFKEKEAFVLAQEKERTERLRPEMEQQEREAEAAMREQEAAAQAEALIHPDADIDAESSSPAIITLIQHDESLSATTAPLQPASSKNPPIVLVPTDSSGQGQENNAVNDIKAPKSSEDVISDAEAIKHDNLPAKWLGRIGPRFAIADVVVPSPQPKFEWPGTTRPRTVRPLFGRHNAAAASPDYSPLGSQADTGAPEPQGLEAAFATAAQGTAGMEALWAAQRAKRTEWAEQLLAENQRRTVLRKEAAEEAAEEAGRKEEELEEEEACKEAQRKEDEERMAKEIDEVQRELQRQDERWRAEQARISEEAEERESATLEAQAARERVEAGRREREARERAEAERERERARLSELIRRAKVDKEKEAAREEEEDTLKEKVEVTAEAQETVRPQLEQRKEPVQAPKEEDMKRMELERRTPQELLPHPPPPPAYHSHGNDPQPVVYMAAPQVLNTEQQRHAMEEDRARMERRGGPQMQMMHAPPPFAHPPQRHHQVMYQPYPPHHPQQFHQPHQLRPPHPQNAVHQLGPHINHGPHTNGQQHHHPANMAYPLGPQHPPRVVHAGHHIHQAHPVQQPQQLHHQHQQHPPLPQYNGPQKYQPHPNGVQYGPPHPPAGDNIWARPGHDDYDGGAGGREMKHRGLVTTQSLPTMLDPEQAARLRATGTPFVIDGKPRMMPPRFHVPQQHPPSPKEPAEVAPVKTLPPRLQQNGLRPPLYKFKPAASPGVASPGYREPSPAAKTPSPATKEPTPAPSPAVTPQEPPQREVPLRQFQIPKPRVRGPVEIAVTPNDKYPEPGMLPPVIGMLPQHPARALPAFQPQPQGDLRRLDARPPDREMKALAEIEGTRAFMEKLMVNVGENYGDVKIRKENRR